jgi:hypothetical protein
LQNARSIKYVSFHGDFKQFLHLHMTEHTFISPEVFGTCRGSVLEEVLSVFVFFGSRHYRTTQVLARGSWTDPLNDQAQTVQAGGAAAFAPRAQFIRT